MRYMRIPVIVDILTWDEFLDFGRKHAINSVDGMPWSFYYKGFPITYENDECYLIPTLDGTEKMTTNHVLVINSKGCIYPCEIEIFKKTYVQTK